MTKCLSTYQAYLVELNKHFTHVTYNYLARKTNQFRDAFAMLVAMINVANYSHSMPLSIEKRNQLAHC